MEFSRQFFIAVHSSPSCIFLFYTPLKAKKLLFLLFLLKLTWVVNGGGIIVFVKKNLNIFNLVIDHDNLNEIISFIIKLPNDFNLGIIACYRPPHYQNEDGFFNALDGVISNFDNNCKEVIIAGDLNYDMLDNNKSIKLKNFIDINGFKNTISDGTRLNPTTGKLTLLDVILCLFTSFFIVSSSFFYPCSDHKLVVSVFKHKSIRNKSRVINTRCLNTPTLDKIKEKLLFYFT